MLAGRQESKQETNLEVKSHGDQKKVRDQSTKHVVLVFQLLPPGSKHTLPDSASPHWGRTRNTSLLLCQPDVRCTLSTDCEPRQRDFSSRLLAVSVTQQVPHLSSQQWVAETIGPGSRFCSLITGPFRGTITSWAVPFLLMPKSQLHRVPKPSSCGTCKVKPLLFSVPASWGCCLSFGF